MYSISLENSRARCDIHKQHVFTGKELKFLFQPTFSRDYSGRVASECSFQSSRHSFHSVHWPFPFGFRGIPFARESPVFSSFSAVPFFLSLPFLRRFVICDFWHASYSWVGRVKHDPWEASMQNIKFNLTNSINPTNEVHAECVVNVCNPYTRFCILFPPFFSLLTVLF